MVHVEQLIEKTETVFDILKYMNDTMQNMYFARISKTKKILDDDYHTANKYFLKLKSGLMFKFFKGNKRFVNSCYPSAVKVFNNSPRRMCPL